MVKRKSASFAYHKVGKGREKMIKHIVMFQLKDQAEGKSKEENLAEAMEKLNHFKAEIPSLVGFEARTNSKEADQGNYDLALLCDFEDMEGLDSYQVHPVHKEFGAFITPRRQSRACIDYEY